MKFIAIALAAISLTACGKFERVTAAVTGYSTICVGGVEYIQFTSGASVAYLPDGKIKTCSK